MTEFKESSGNESKRLSQLEVEVLRVMPHIHEAGRTELKAHWNKYKIAQSGVDYKSLVGLNGARPLGDSELWKLICGSPKDDPASAVKRANYVLRKVGIFNVNIQNAKRLGKKVNLVTTSKSFRDSLDNKDSWQVAAVFTHFCGQWEKMINQVAWTSSV